MDDGLSGYVLWYVHNHHHNQREHSCVHVTTKCKLHHRSTSRVHIFTLATKGVGTRDCRRFHHHNFFHGNLTRASRVQHTLFRKQQLQKCKNANANQKLCHHLPYHAYWSHYYARTSSTTHILPSPEPHEQPRTTSANQNHHASE